MQQQLTQNKLLIKQKYVSFFTPKTTCSFTRQYVFWQRHHLFQHAILQIFQNFWQINLCQWCIRCDLYSEFTLNSMHTLLRHFSGNCNSVWVLFSIVSRVIGVITHVFINSKEEGKKTRSILFSSKTHGNSCRFWLWYFALNLFFRISYTYADNKKHYNESTVTQIVYKGYACFNIVRAK